MYDRFNRKINYLRISVTDRCNLRCTYCMPAEGIELVRHKDILSFEEILEVVKTGVEYGINKVRITGGEPLVRKGIIELVSMIARVPGVEDLSMTTNGALLDLFAGELANAGLQRINISLDTMDPKRYREITRVGNLSSAISGIIAARLAGLSPIKINCVIKESPLEKDSQDVAQFCKQNDLEVRFIKEMDLENGRFSKVIGGDGGNCAICNRLRLTANGKIKPCLFSDLEFDIRELGVEEAFLKAVGQKPREGTKSKVNKFSNIGG
ncbi:MAG TPA: radical SAM protein [Bacteroidales bacterium]|nr:radical SAM protein [Bacteroidales bacterium]HRX97849.1 radical SAM protein [Bacteroidales bacterium]